MTGAVRCEIAGESFQLFPEKVAYWEGQSSLLAADVHLGKSATFRSVGMPVPESIGQDLGRLTTAIEGSRATRLIILGDLFHAPEGQTSHVRAALAGWRSRHPELEILVTRGNHDRACDSLLEDCGIAIRDVVELGGLRFQHETSPGVVRRGRYRIGGHLHPAVRIADPTRSFRLPCFWFGESDGVLPAFGAFTGSHVIERVPGDRVYAVAEDRVVEV